MTLSHLVPNGNGESLARPYDVITQAQARDIDELAKPVTFRVRAPGGVTRTMTCPVVHP